MIYYSSSTGTIIGGTSGSDLTGITHLPSSADYAIYTDDATVQSLNPNKEPGTYSFGNVVAGPKYVVPTATGTLQFTALSTAQQLSNAQTAQIALVTAGFNSTLSGNFTSKTTGHTYATNTQADMMGELQRFQLDATVTSINFETTDAGYTPHTVAQLQSAFLDGGKWKQAQFTQLNNLVAQINAAATISAVQGITWTPATY